LEKQVEKFKKENDLFEKNKECAKYKDDMYKDINSKDYSFI